jgi:hypothetical protein
MYDLFKLLWYIQANIYLTSTNQLIVDVLMNMQVWTYE